jgi:hypothetical protein
MDITSNSILLFTVSACLLVDACFNIIEPVPESLIQIELNAEQAVRTIDLSNDLIDSIMYQKSIHTQNKNVFSKDFFELMRIIDRSTEIVCTNNSQSIKNISRLAKTLRKEYLIHPDAAENITNIEN